MEMGDYEHGVPSWVDLGTDVDAAKPFYAGLFGWDIPDLPPEAGGYCIALLRGRPVAGLGPKMNPGPPAWLTYVNVDDADAIAEKVAANGGSAIMAPSDVMDVGRMGVFADPTGAVFGVWQPRAHKGAGIVNEPGSMCWNELMTTDVAGSAPFYGSVFGWDTNTVGSGAETYTEWQLGGRSIGGMMAKPEGVPAEVPPNWGVYFAVADADAAVARVSELGGSLLMGPMDIEPGRFAVLLDPTGATFNVLALKSGTEG